MAKNIQIISANGRPVRVGAQVAPADGTPITVDLDDVTVVRHLDSRRGEWLQLDDVASGGGGGGTTISDKVLVLRRSTYSLPGVLNQVHTILPGGTNQDVTTSGANKGAFQLTESEIAGTLGAGQKLQFYLETYASFTFNAPVSAGTGVLRAGIGRISGDVWAANGNFTLSTPNLEADMTVDTSVNVDYEASDDEAIFETDGTADGVWFAPYVFMPNGTAQAVTNGFLIEIALWARIEAV